MASSRAFPSFTCQSIFLVCRRVLRCVQVCLCVFVRLKEFCFTVCAFNPPRTNTRSYISLWISQLNWTYSYCLPLPFSGFSRCSLPLVFPLEQSVHFVFILFDLMWPFLFLPPPLFLLSLPPLFSQGDRGGRLTLQKRWTSFLKARLVCSLPEYDFHFNMLRSVFILPGQTPQDTLFYGIFGLEW